jgi:hypothetical protein
MIATVSYTFKVTVKDGKASVEHTNPVPDGEWTVSGHDDTGHQTVSVTRAGGEGRPYVQASSAHGRTT